MDDNIFEKKFYTKSTNQIKKAAKNSGKKQMEVGTRTSFKKRSRFATH